MGSILGLSKSAFGESSNGILTSEDKLIDLEPKKMIYPKIISTWNHGMAANQKAWETIKNHTKVTVTIDTFQWGIVFFRAEQEKEHFVIRV